MEKIYRLHYRAQLQKGINEEALLKAMEECKNNIRALQENGKVLTAALYRHEQMLFLYYEAVGEPLSVIEPIKAEGLLSGSVLLESGEDVQATVVHPAEFLAPLAPYLMIWPGQVEDRLWVHMYYIYYHNVPESVEHWKRAAVPQQRKGRIAFLRDEKVFSYVYYHKAIVDEGLLWGDRYQSIALHENVLFSYFEEPKTVVNIKGVKDKKSEVIKDWFAVDPESHFIHMPQGEGDNFMFLPALFAMGVEDLSGQ